MILFHGYRLYCYRLHLPFCGKMLGEAPGGAGLTTYWSMLVLAPVAMTAIVGWHWLDAAATYGGANQYCGCSLMVTRDGWLQQPSGFRLWGLRGGC